MGKSSSKKQASMIFVTKTPLESSQQTALRTHPISDTKVQNTTTVVYPQMYKGHFDKLILSNYDIQKRCKEMAIYIHNTYPHNEPLVLMCTLKGSAPFFSMLCNELSLVGHPYMIEFYRAQSYEGLSSSQHVKMDASQLPKSIQGRHLLIVEDIIDTGLTMQKLMEAVETKNPKSCKACSMLVKRLEQESGNTTNQVSFEQELIGFSIPDKFVVGFGLDYNQMYRDLRDIWILNETGIKYGGFEK
ncbi:hypoxanthine phosphoribosyltransferase [Chaetoceros tenuissimus]|uniref:Hypoxanthine phosphoribosyltransferase n=1 Tax=Chaetoceros tenuissimus TaxID=426638 RepID=A0AAD3HA46_9STRA|nr:hypoxanthine phosphoribosyltransferase [Chaetoceros tenuissimus]